MPNPSDSPDDPSASPLELLRARFALMPGAREEGRVLHRIDEALMIAFCSMLSDNDAFTDMEAFGKTRERWLRSFLPLSNGRPATMFSATSLSRSGPGALLDILADWCGDWCGDLAGRQIEIDGKALRGTAAASTTRERVHVRAPGRARPASAPGRSGAGRRATSWRPCLASWNCSSSRAPS